MSAREPESSDDTEERCPILPVSTAVPKLSRRGRPRKNPKSITEVVAIRRPTSREEKPSSQGHTTILHMRPQSPQPSTSRDSLARAGTSPDYSSRESSASVAIMGPLIEHKLNRSARHMRNLAEKMRRDKLNTYVSELAAIVPPVAESSKKVDKTSVLRLAANFIRMHNMLGGDAASEPILPSGLPAEAARGLMETLGNKFLLVATNTGKIVFVSDAIEQTFGHGQMELLGCSLYSFVHHDDCDLLRTQLTPSDTTRRSFFCRFVAKSLSRNEARSYEIIHVQGHLRPVPPTPAPTLIKQELDEETSLLEEDALPPVRHRRSTRHYGSLHISEDSSGSEEFEEGRAPRGRDSHLLVALVHLIKERPLTELSRVESMRDEYITRHDACGTIMYTDHRITYVTGYMPENVRGSSAFMYMHQNDLLWSLVAQKQMLQTEHKREGVVSYRLRCRDNSYITLHSRGYLELNKQTKAIESFVCINSVVDEKQSEREIRQQRRQLLPVIAGASADDLMANLSSEFPVEIMKIVQNTLGQKKIQQLLSATASNVEQKAATSHRGQSSATITEITDDDSSIFVKGKSPRRIPSESKTPKPKSSNEDGSKIKSDDEMWITLNEESCFKANGRARKRSHSEEMCEEKLESNVVKRSARSNSESSTDSEMMSPNEISDKGSLKLFDDEPYRYNKKIRYDRLEDPSLLEASTSWTNDNSTFLSSEPSTLFDDIESSQQACLEADARKKKQMLQMEQMAYSMKQIHTHNSQPNSSVGITEQTADEYQAGHNQEQQLSHLHNTPPFSNVDRKNLSYSVYSQQQYPKCQVLNLDKQRLDITTLNLTSDTVNSEGHSSDMQAHRSLSNNLLPPNFTLQSPKSSSGAADSSVQYSKPSNSRPPSPLGPLSPSNGKASKQPTTSIPENSVESSCIADSLHFLDASLAELVDCLGGSPNPQTDDSSSTPNTSSTLLLNPLQPLSIEVLSSELDTVNAPASPVSPHVYPRSPSISVSPDSQFSRSPRPCGGGRFFPGTCDQKWNQSDQRGEQHCQAGQHAADAEGVLKGLSSDRQTNELVVQNEQMTQQQRQEGMLQQQRHQSQAQRSEVPQQHCREGGYRQDL